MLKKLDYLQNNHDLAGYERKELNIRSDLSNHFLLGYFDDDKVLIEIISKEKGEDGFFVQSKIFVSKDCIQEPGVVKSSLFIPNKEFTVDYSFDQLNFLGCFGELVLEIGKNTDGVGCTG